ncbi:hypothetical protein KM043_011928 [Ampulex compressa]|nr:hypothetical protein KM043_011928 [Ampulex compressa]
MQADSNHEISGGNPRCVFATKYVPDRPAAAPRSPSTVHLLPQYLSFLTDNLGIRGAYELLGSPSFPLEGSSEKDRFLLARIKRRPPSNGEGRKQKCPSKWSSL